MNIRNLLLLFPLATGSLVAGEVRKVELSDRVKAFVGKYCLDCHNTEKEKGDLDLEKLSYVLDDISTAQYWQDVLDVLNLSEMPPEKKGGPHPSKAEMTQMLEDLTNSLVDARKYMADTGGRLVSRRLNKREYSRFVTELLGVDVDMHLLPDDDNFEGFDTVGSSHSLTGFHLERYLRAAKDALGKLKPAVEAEPVKRVDIKSRTTTAKVKAEYEKYKKLYESGARKHPEMDFEIYRRTSPTNRTTYKAHYLRNKNLYENFERFEEGWVLTSPSKGFSAKVDMEGKPAGKYILRMRIAAAGKDQDEGRYVYLQRSVSQQQDRSPRTLFHTNGTMAEPEILDIPFQTFGLQSTYTLRFREPGEPQRAEDQEYIRPFSKNRKITWYDKGIWVDWHELIGPLNPYKNRYEEVFFQGTEPSEDAAGPYAETILKHFSERAFRGKTPEEADIASAMKFYHLAKENGRNFEEAVKEAMAYIMVSPRFLFAIEDGSEKIALLGSRELANRLALFLWSSLPDEELLKTAAEGSLLEDKVLSTQVDRMLKDPKAEAFFHNFLDQWLGLHEIESVAFPEDFKNLTLTSAKGEPFETYKHLVRENLSITNLIKSDFVMVNSLLAEFYGLEGVAGNGFRPVKVPSDSVRGGLLGMSAILGMGGDGEKSLPIKRGAFVAAKIIDRHPPSPPPNVPLIKVDGRQSTRKLFEAHSNKPACASCHQRFDSFGFALESFDELGRWRDKETLKWKTVMNKDGSEKMVKLKEPVEVPIETNGVLEDGVTKFGDFKEMTHLLATRKGDHFAGGMVGAMIKYGIGRPVSFTDTEMIGQMVSQSRRNGYRARDLIHSFVLSRAFRSK